MTTETTVTHPAEDWSDGPIGNDDGYTDGNDFEESMEFPSNTIGGIIERAVRSAAAVRRYREEWSR